VRTVTTTSTAPEPTVEDLDGIIKALETSWTSRITVSRQSKDDIGLRQIYVSLDDEGIGVLCAGEEVTREVPPGPHRVRVHNTLFWRTLSFTLAVGEHARFSAINRRGFLTYSVWAFLLGTNPIYLSLKREEHHAA
jgi:hypothetical protein